MQTFETIPTVASIVEEILAQPRIPHATYRFQFQAQFTFQDALALLPYLDALGISDCYASPIFMPRAGSTHGYDICDHNRINPALGGEEGFDQFAAALRERGMGLLIDVVPNHMGIGDTANTWWFDVLENGPGSSYAAYFDIEWKPVKPELENKVLLPILEDQYGKVLEDGKLRLGYDEGAFVLHYYEQRLPIAPRTYGQILSHALETLEQQLDPSSEQLQDYQSILTAISYLPPRTERDPAKLAERNREKEVIKRRLSTLTQGDETIHSAIDDTLRVFNGRVGTPQSFDLLDELINAQAYRLAYWRVAGEEINYRRFFDINDLAAIRTEEPEVFQATHQLVFRLLAEGQATGLRLDHIDGLYDPSGYLRRLQEGYVFHVVRARLAQTRETMPDDLMLTTQITALLEPTYSAQNDQERPVSRARPLYVVAEKILGARETLPDRWAVYGTTGYDFLTMLNQIFVDTHNAHSFDTIYHDFSGLKQPFAQLVNANKKMIMLVAMASEIYTLSHQLERIAEQNRRYRDFTLDTLTFALREIIAALSVYRTYITDPESVSEHDATFIERAVAIAKRRNPRTAEALFNFIRDTVLLRNLTEFRSDDQIELLRWVGKFQQLSGPVMAKGVEDTAFYVYNRLVSLNEVGGHPEEFGADVDAFHAYNQTRQRDWPHTMLATSTHDTKRSEDVRARINVLSELPTAWREALGRWSVLNADKKTSVDAVPAPDANDEYLFYQTLLGAWPFQADGVWNGEGGLLLHPNGDRTPPEAWAAFRDRLVAYMQKATKEAKVHTSWVNPNQAYDAAVQDFVCRVLDPADNGAFLADAQTFATRIAFFGQFNALSQVLLKLTAPGVPDIYQGTELWDLSLVDPDNRRPVDYALRQELLAQIQQRIAQAPRDEAGVPLLHELARELLANSADGRIKLYLVHQALCFRRANETLLLHGDYQPLTAQGAQREHVCAFARTLDEAQLLVCVPRLLTTLTGGARPPLGADVWGDTWLALPGERTGRRYRNCLTGETLHVEEQAGGVGLRLSAICTYLPLALLERVGD